MKKYQFQSAKAIFYPFTAQEAAKRQKEAVHHYGFHMCYSIQNVLEDVQSATLALTARNIYRLYINGELVMHGPARTAHGYARVDVIDVRPYLQNGDNHFGVEVMVYGDVYGGYSNDCTLESGMFIAELTLNNQVVSSSGDDSWSWKVTPLLARVPNSQRISHSREAAEIYVLDETYNVWDLGFADYRLPAILPTEPTYLPHDALKPSLKRYDFSKLVSFGSCYIDATKPLTSLFYERHSPYYHALEEFPLEDCRRTIDTTFGGVNVQRTTDSLLLEGECDKFVLFDGGASHVGFIKVNFDCAHAGIVDIVHSELLDKNGNIPYYHNVVTRLHVENGTHSLITMEPCLARYIKIYFRGTGDVQLFPVTMYDDAYPDEMRSAFQCSNDDINRLYNAAKDTLILNTMDIFMDCPERERGGWLCDSLWTSRAAHMMLSDPRVEREFIQNFLLTPSDGMHRGLFPEAYPGNKPGYTDCTGISTWSFWLMCELCEYMERTGDIDLRDTYAKRVEDFVNGSLKYKGKSGLLEHLPNVFIDWSLANERDYTQPISTAANALYAYMLINLGMLYGRHGWIMQGQEMRRILRDAIIEGQELGLASLETFSDSFNVDENGRIRPTGKISESGMTTALWAGLFLPGEAPLMDAFVRDSMGPAPRYPSNPNIGKSGLFIGLCIRLDMLSRFGMYDKMYEDMLAIYMPQLTEGPGTLWENTMFETSSRCHGFASHAGVHLMRDILGMGIPQVKPHKETSHITLSPHICGLRFARGSMETPQGIISLSWVYDGMTFTLNASLPSGYTYDLVLPREVKCLDEANIRVDIRVRP